MNFDLLRTEKEIIKFLKELVNTPSQNGIDSERKVANLVFRKLSSLGFAPEKIGEKNHPSIFCKLNKNPHGKTVWLESCLDTVPIGDISKWKYYPFEGSIKGNRMYGRGAADSKMGIAIFCYLAERLFSIPEFKGNIILGFDADEQSGNFSGIREILKRRPKADVCVLGYQGVDEISIGARGWLRLRITAKGKSAHTGSRSKKGVNAIHRMVDIITLLEKLHLGEKKEKFFEYGSSFNVSLIHGGIAINIVPDECEIKVDIRLLPSQKKKEVLDTIDIKLKGLRKENPRLSYKIEVLQHEKAFLTNPRNNFIKILQKTARKELKRKISLVTSGAGSVGNIISQTGTPVVNGFGCDCDNVHAPNEWVDISHIPTVFEIYRKTILEFSKQ